jgi:(4-alkanoyl-5-oxo-2,5-dihydrofuran-3-yl)methyl phosphate reductase
MILVTGATGKVGGAVLEQLLAEGHAVRALARDPGKLEKVSGKLEIAKGDLAKPETLDAAFAGARAVFVMGAGGDMVALVGNAIAAAKKAGVLRVVFLSSSSASSEHETRLGNWHRAAEAIVKESGIAFTILQPGGFASNALQWVRPIKAQGAVFRPTGDGKTAPIDPGDIAAVAVKALTTPGHEGKSYVLSGPEALSMEEQVAKLGAAIGKPLRFVDVTAAAAREGMAREGMPEVFIEAMLEISAEVKAGRAGEVTTTVEEILGRKPQTFDAWAARNAAAFA